MPDDVSTVPAKATKDAAARRAIQIATQFSLESIRFIRFSGSRRSATFDELSDANPVIRFTRPGVHRTESGVRITSTFVFSVIEDQAELEPIIDLRTTVELTYREVGTESREKTIGDDELRLFADYNAPFHAWGYWREFVHSGLHRLDLPAFTLPMFRIIDVPRFMLAEE